MNNPTNGTKGVCVQDVYYATQNRETCLMTKAEVDELVWLYLAKGTPLTWSEEDECWYSDDGECVTITYGVPL